MKQILRAAGVLSLTLLSINSFSQRYLTDQFTQVTETINVVYDSNYAVNIIPPNNPPLVKQGLLCDIYEPTGDTETERPVILLLHTGSFLPPIVNKQVTGSKADSAIVEMSRRFARKGYVVVALNYRLGWNPTTTDADQATAQLLQATYRGLQDAKNCVRFMRENHMMYGVDTNRFAVGGIGTGGYIALAYSALNKQEEVELEKFRYSVDPFPPMVNTGAFGNWDGVGGIAPYNIPGDSNISVDINAAFHVGGAIGDSIWLEGNEVPTFSMHCLRDPYAPFEYGNVIVPTTGVTVINQAAGGGVVQRIATRFGINDTAANRDYNDVYTTRANAINNGNQGLYPFILPARSPSFANEGSPWEWWDSTIVKSINFPSAGAGQEAHDNSMFNNPDMSKTKAMAYIDTMQGFLAPRLVCAMGLPGCPAKNTTSVKKMAKDVFNVYPNPNKGSFTLKANSNSIIDKVEVYDMSGKLMYTADANSTEVGVQLQVNSGLYLVRVYSQGSISTSQIMVD